MRCVRIGYEMLEGSSEQLVLDVVVGRATVLGAEVKWRDSEGVILAFDTDDADVAKEIKRYIKYLVKSVRVKFEDGWVRPRPPDIFVVEDC
ncbi:hypothetical protein Pogu_2101 [Pyrobaculum oguniense TE7]|uniref:Uncharacterized protein n=1 Tax=Pyrobaculum oguniense (strain DSM 13380 / JCM 10595 / TE7) TaxID=698757 RepID=H6QCT2_PYROT|nr:hypothetical protein Pogu_2101 [Pyrobaculum oguniense TE7]